MSGAPSPGPWSLRSGENIPAWQNPLQIQDATGLCIVSLEWSPLHDAAANARLMSAAPDLYEALRLYINAGHGNSTHFGDQAGAYSAAMRAIAKAEGRRA